MFFEIAGLTLNGIGVVSNLLKTYRDLRNWDERDIEVDNNWLDIALAKKILQGKPDDFAWMAARRVPTAELRGTHAAVIVYNSDKKVKYRIVQGRPDDRNILVQELRLPPP